MINSLWPTISWLSLSLIMQTILLFQLPASQGFSRPVPTATMLLAECISLFALSRLLSSGSKLSVIVPLISGAVPLLAIVIGTGVSGEKASLPKTAMLISACLLVGLASRFE